MKIFYYALIALIAVSAPTRLFAAEQDDVLIPVQQFFDSIAARDAAMMKSSGTSSATVLFMRDTGPAQSTFEQFAERIARPGTTKLEETIHDSVIRVENDVAMIWAPAVFKIDNKVDHCAIDVFVLIRQNGKWLISSFANTRKSCS